MMRKRRNIKKWKRKRQRR